MHPLRPLLATWACLAQASLAAVSFTKWPTTVYPGKPATVYWKGDSDTPVTITLRQGPAGNLRTLKVLTHDGQGGSFTWVPDESLAPGSDYALQIEQDGSINYSGLVTLVDQPGKKAQPSSSKHTSLSSPLGGARTSVQEGNNGYIPTLNSSSTPVNMTSGKSTAHKTSNDGVTFRYISAEMILAAMAAVVYFAA
ncbi:GPI anchored serine-threonine rich family protein [Aspergillus foveolatus]|uniref:GPI anchored serine-threonine rich family protein n=1 Tax=Aspergillus foveolatus TaxID=210207 RepID=UPI003CCDBDCB